MMILRRLEWVRSRLSISWRIHSICAKWPLRYFSLHPRSRLHRTCSPPALPHPLNKKTSNECVRNRSTDTTATHVFFLPPPPKQLFFTIKHKTTCIKLLFIVCYWFYLCEFYFWGIWFIIWGLSVLFFSDVCRDLLKIDLGSYSFHFKCSLSLCVEIKLEIVCLISSQIHTQLFKKYSQVNIKEIQISLLCTVKGISSPGCGVQTLRWLPWYVLYYCTAKKYLVNICTGHGKLLSPWGWSYFSLWHSYISSYIKLTFMNFLFKFLKLEMSTTNSCTWSSWCL